ncbi:response regulator [Marinobacter salicampi]|uniref:response regulator n=1 Tax=Marinobacter salicampi TaxID=435907 RepID=UPI00140DB009|nr:response regulator [Marinobacter salicampi]
MHILIVEDDELVGDGLKAGLEALGQTSDWVRSARAADIAMGFARFDVVILDLGLPDEDGMTLLKRWRDKGVDQPILVLTARDAVPERIAGLESGADDYLTKPFDLGELVARLHSLIRRAEGRSTNLVQHGPLTLDPVRLEVRMHDEPVPLSRRELAVLQALLQNPGQILAPGQLQDSVYGWSEGVESNAIAVHVHNLRRKLGDDLIETVRGLGYRLNRVAK